MPALLPAMAPDIFRAMIIAILVQLQAYTLLGLAAQSSPHAAASWVSFALGVATAVAGLYASKSVLGGVALCGWVVQGRRLAQRLEADVRGGTGSTRAVPLQAARALFMLDGIRSFFALAVWGILGRGVEALVTLMLPTGLRVHSFGAPVDDLGGSLQIGLCLFLEGEQTVPGHVVLNVGHIPTADLDDVRSTVRSSLNIMKELSRSDAAPVAGFVANLLCILPEAGCTYSPINVGWRSVREVNLSVWGSQESAATWYRHSAAHAAILSEHRSGGLRTFGNLLLSLQPVACRFQRRCSACRSAVEGVASDLCPHCSGATFPLPVF